MVTKIVEWVLSQSCNPLSILTWIVKEMQKMKVNLLCDMKWSHKVFISIYELVDHKMQVKDVILYVHAVYMKLCLHWSYVQTWMLTDDGQFCQISCILLSLRLLTNG